MPSGLQMAQHQEALARARRDVVHVTYPTTRCVPCHWPANVNSGAGKPICVIGQTPLTGLALFNGRFDFPGPTTAL